MLHEIAPAVLEGIRRDEDSASPFRDAFKGDLLCIYIVPAWITLTRNTRMYTEPRWLLWISQEAAFSVFNIPRAVFPGSRETSNKKKENA